MTLNRGCFVMDTMNFGEVIAVQKLLLVIFIVSGVSFFVVGDT